MHGHLVAIEIGVEGGADERMDLDGFAVDQHGLEGLDAQAVERGGAVEQDRVVLNDLLENVPNDRILLLDQFLACLMVVQWPRSSSRW